MMDQQTTDSGAEALERLLLKPHEAAHVLGIGRTRLFELIASGALESVRIGSSRRVPRGALEDFVVRVRAEQNHHPRARLRRGA